MLAVCTVDTESFLSHLIYNIYEGLLLQRHKSPEMWLSGQSVTARDAVKVCGSTPQSLQIQKRSLTWWERKTRKSSDFTERIGKIERVLCMQRSGPPHVWGLGLGEGIKKVNKGARGMPVALGGDEGRDKLRKAAVRGKYPVTRGCPNGETRRQRCRHRT